MTNIFTALPNFGKIKFMGHKHKCFTGKKYQSFLQQIFIEQLPCTGHYSQNCQIQNNKESRGLRQTREFLPGLNSLRLFIYFNQASQTRQIW